MILYNEDFIVRISKEKEPSFIRSGKKDWEVSNIDIDDYPSTVIKLPASSLSHININSTWFNVPTSKLNTLRAKGKIKLAKCIRNGKFI